ncbi:MAG: pyruvate synthase subunit PorB [Nitrososphaeria archaeon]
MNIKDLDREEYILSGNSSCPGCPASLGFRLIGKAVGKNAIIVIPASCMTIIQGAYPNTALILPTLNIAFAASAAAASGISAALEIRGKNYPVIVYAGDGGTADIGLQALSGAAERNENITYICYDNEAYQNTGIQRSGATPYGAWTTTTLKGKQERKKDVPKIMASHNIPYVATASVAYPTDFIEKVKKAIKIKGFKYIHLHAPCPTGWRFPSEKTIEVGRLAVQTGVWILYEIENGVLKLTGPSKNLLEKSARKPVREYLRAQGRFQHLSDEIVKNFCDDIEEKWNEIRMIINLQNHLSTT